MSDIVERLREGFSEHAKPAEHIELEAADEIERLRTLRTPATRQLLNITKAALDSAEAEVERLQAANVRLQEALIFDPKEMQAEIERLEADKAAISDTASGCLHEIERLWDARELLGDALDITKIEHQRMQDEIEQLHIDKAAISDTASGYLHEIERLEEALKVCRELKDAGN